VESPLKKLPKKQGKLPIAQRVSISTKTWVVEANVQLPSSILASQGDAIQSYTQICFIPFSILSKVFIVVHLLNVILLSFWTSGDKTTWHQVLNNTSHLTM